MNDGKTVFSHLFEHILLNDFRKSVRRYQGEYKVQKVSYLARLITRLITRLILGNSPAGDSPWRGDLLSLSFYPEALSPEETGTAGINPVVSYRFSEGRGTVCRGGGDPRHDLFILPVFRAPAKRSLTPPWKVHALDLSFWTDAAVNILGFIPFGFTMFAWMRKDGGRKRLSVPFLVVLTGAGISLLIELLQVYLPTRDSSLTDLVNNILRTYIGALLCRHAS